MFVKECKGFLLSLQGYGLKREKMLTAEQQEWQKKRFESIDACKTVDELVNCIFPKKHSEYKTFYVKEWIEHHFAGTECPNFKHKNAKELAEDIYKPEWDDDTDLFQSLRRHLVNWIETKKKENG